ncbi:MAG TPA: dihydroneopterin aldolase [Zoogloea sp.]|uniref:dihydroneopterin aldolase n=1 Tax=Zoogloea sp. TaxID=49181 RepID=UPI002CC0AEED|nr:dihydroneopterin aldolase [Zoogloea sp.]HMV16904.1 dihydroneopterin aldolase [Rhodocyclaceae bacterium]HMV61852.1 dihydroneopterin aldolase [Rhodocyclaceae bacterium]HMW53530.1 dihydroneopterin aldolase [Rhodocyclaceae bacterium]HMY50230.1 dihydroneopterin aldolase [Rhodocyclaceae bacterium]HMZ77142.1 dihydroneopterin aldolase [Rhodocyclaceae bacterium]
MDFIFIEALRVQARVGIYPRERVAEQTLELNLTFGVPDAAAEHDDIADTIDYAQVIERLRAELAVRQFNLIETLGEFVVKLLFDEFGAPWVKLAIAKMGVMKGVKRVGVFIQRGRNGSAPPEHAPTAGLPG